MASLYADYWKEYAGYDSIEHEHGFIIYKFYDNQTGYIKDVYVSPLMRKQNVGRELGKKVFEKAKELGIQTIFGSVDTQSLNPTQSIAVMLSDGFQFSHLNSTMIYFKKEVQ